MSNANIGWLYYRDYYWDDRKQTLVDFRKLGSKDKEHQKYQEKHFGPKNEQLETSSISAQKYGLLTWEGEEDSIILETLYPGLMSGTGLSHETKSLSESKLGFAFDHTTGIPYLPASSVKGAMRAMFPQWVNTQKRKSIDKSAQKEGQEAEQAVRELRENQNAFISFLLESESINISQEDREKRLEEYCTEKGIELLELIEAESDRITLENPFIDLLELELFEGIIPAIDLDDKEPKPHLKPLSVYKRDIFHDAFPIPKDSEGDNQRFIGFDFITPHKHKDNPVLDPFTNPNPIMFLKILPGVQFRFQFDFQDGLLTAQQKQELMKMILLTSGAGAKTNVGYGQFQEPIPPREFTIGEELQGEVSKMDPISNRFLVKIKEVNWEKSLQVKDNIFRQLTEGNSYTFKVSKINEDGSIRSVSVILPENRPNKGRNRR